MSPIRFDYPDPGWSTGKMRKLSDVRRAQPQFEEPGIAEASRLAGAGIGARGGISPGVIEQQKAAIQSMGQQWNLGTIDWRTFHKRIKDYGWGIETFTENLPGAKRMEDLRRQFKDQGEINLTDPNGNSHTGSTETDSCNVRDQQKTCNNN